MHLPIQQKVLLKNVKNAHIAIHYVHQLQNQSTFRQNRTEMFECCQYSIILACIPKQENYHVVKIVRTNFIVRLSLVLCKFNFLK